MCPQRWGRWVVTALSLAGQNLSLITTTPACMRKGTAAIRWVHYCLQLCQQDMLYRYIDIFSFKQLSLCACVSGHVLCVGEGSVHRGLQHLSGLPHRGHGHPVQVQVRRLVVEDRSAAGRGGVGILGGLVLGNTRSIRHAWRGVCFFFLLDIHVSFFIG